MIRKTVFWFFGLSSAFLIGFAEYTTVMNDLYQTGSVIFDSTIFANVIWRSGWGLHLGPLFGEESFYFTHVSPIMYLPSLVSYVFPGDRITFFALTYALVYAGTTFVVYRLIVMVMPSFIGLAAAAAASLVFFCTQPVFAAAFEPHMEVASPVFGMLMFGAWQRRHYGRAALWLAVNAAIREDIGAVFGVALLGFASAQYLELRKNDPVLARERLRQGSMLCLLGASLTVAAFALQAYVAQPFRLMHDLYFPADHPFSHLSAANLKQRIMELYHLRHGIWLPLLAILIAGGLLRDLPLMMGGLCFLPYFFINFISMDDNSATLTAYKPFPFVVMLLMPVLVGALRPVSRRWHYAALQWVVLLAATVTYFPGQWEVAKGRWIPGGLTYHTESYQAFGMLLPPLMKQGGVWADPAVQAIYPYQTGTWWNNGTESLTENDDDKVKTLLWFWNSAYNFQVKALLACHTYAIAHMPGTNIYIARRVP